VLVGENGSGKSNLVDVLRFVRDALAKGLDAAVMERGGFKQIIHQKAATQEIEITLKLHIGGKSASYQLIIELTAENAYQILLEKLDFAEYWYTVQPGKSFTSTWDYQPDLELLKHRLFMPLISHSEIKAIHNFLSEQRFPDIQPDNLRQPQKASVGLQLADDGSNLLSVLQGIVQADEYEAEIIATALSRIVPSIQEENPFRFHELGGYLLLELQHEHGIFNLGQESDGTIRALGLLTALYQKPYLPLIAIEDVEILIYPRMMTLLSEVLREAALRHQTLVTSHSPDLLSHFPPEAIRLVEIVDGGSKIAPIRKANLEALEKNLFSTGDLLRIGALGRAE
jgi:predicted ATPase